LIRDKDRRSNPAGKRASGGNHVDKNHFALMRLSPTRKLLNSPTCRWIMLRLLSNKSYVSASCPLKQNATFVSATQPPLFRCVGCTWSARECSPSHKSSRIAAGTCGATSQLDGIEQQYHKTLNVRVSGISVLLARSPPRSVQMQACASTLNQRIGWASSSAISSHAVVRFAHSHDIPPLDPDLSTDFLSDFLTRSWSESEELEWANISETVYVCSY
jgi:hypothetical protein